jgi:Na+/glutamate symporter
MTMRSILSNRRTAIALVAGVAMFGLAACESTGGSGGAGVGTAGGAALGAGAGRLIFGNSTTGMLIGAGVGGLAGNMAIDRPAEQRRAEQQQQDADRAMQRQLEFERQRALQAEETRREIEEQRLFNEWLLQRNATSS